jgi:hypothetical protein
MRRPVVDGPELLWPGEASRAMLPAEVDGDPIAPTA